MNLLGFLLLIFCALPAQTQTQCQSPKSDADFINLRDTREDCQRYIPQLDKLQSDLLQDADCSRYKLQLSDKNLSSGLRGFITSQSSACDLLPPPDELKKQVQQKQAELDAARKTISDIEVQMSRIIDLERPKQAFKGRMSIAFSILVGIVIFGFFGVAFIDGQVRRDIFAGQAGMQFVTLFSLVIAIILFGITQILEGKELSALLGGLSGYILGRGSGQNQQPPQNQQPAQNQQLAQNQQPVQNQEQLNPHHDEEPDANAHEG